MYLFQEGKINDQATQKKLFTWQDYMAYALQTKKKDQYLIVPGHSKFKPFARVQTPWHNWAKVL